MTNRRVRPVLLALVVLAVAWDIAHTGLLLWDAVACLGVMQIAIYVTPARRVLVNHDDDDDDDADVIYLGTLPPPPPTVWQHFVQKQRAALAWSSTTPWTALLWCFASVYAAAALLAAARLVAKSLGCTLPGLELVLQAIGDFMDSDRAQGQLATRLRRLEALAAGRIGLRMAAQLSRQMIAIEGIAAALLAGTAVRLMLLAARGTLRCATLWLSLLPHIFALGLYVVVTPVAGPKPPRNPGRLRRRHRVLTYFCRAGKHVAQLALGIPLELLGRLAWTGGFNIFQAWLVPSSSTSNDVLCTALQDAVRAFF
ncbi:hypothetical protein SDRG_02620 [Saprolegnia diclina VS20]|uniref:Uncharacterized protein n=1 Tax=Saprolegnia diclina (strain VS20) TaxID=1156394 RepID=T0QPF1_SAPDV|nr:hypothetical protein SDRG_02620 [Saprolegnia diclina VS20]EQC39964.1 hypothetical protein SDRG_02620 [Saprolegnia diclina VS20]|eukprot:XP_008606438.1 hypothetical protein SDRG_02620 [Saprolegnia diclina VS20]